MFFEAGVALCVGGIYAGSKLVEWIRDPRRALIGLERTRLCDARDGEQIACVGVIRRAPFVAELFAAPVSGRSCVGWSIKAVAGWPLGEDLRTGVLQDFVLDDGSGDVALVRGATDWTLLAADHESANHDEANFQEKTYELLWQLGLEPTHRNFSRVEEAVLEEGERAMIVATVSRAPDVYRTGAWQLELVAADGGLRVSDDARVVAD
ncbi:MAG: hypothetical protein KC503_24820 [Myxococcales bacterium]|nr:hypothetical protein [Myxococcales bacterium]